LTLRACLAALSLAFLFSGCAGTPPRSEEDPAFKKAYEQRLERLLPIDHWAVEGRLAISDGHEGGSGSLAWMHDGEATRMSFRGALGRGAWQLLADSSGARLELADGSVEHAASVAELVLNQVGWKVPVEALSWWIKGLAHPDPWQARVLDEEGRLISLQQFGWEVDFDRYGEASNFWLPSKLTARRGDYRLKMAVRRWRLGEEATAID